MSRAVEESNRRMLRARDAMDRDYAEPLDIPTLAKIAYVYRKGAADLRAVPACFAKASTGPSSFGEAHLGFMRWLTVNLPGHPERELLLEKPGPPAHDEATAERVRELVTKGALGMAGIFTVDDIHKTYKELLAKGVEFTEEPTERFYGTDCGLRDPFGNHIRIGEPKEGPIEVPDPAQLAAEYT